MDNEFKLEINTKNTGKNVEVHVCLRCLEGVCGNIIEKLKEEYEGEDNIEDYMCLVYIKLLISYGMNIMKERRRRIVMTDFYNNVTKYGRGLSHLSNKLKGGARAILCVLLKKAVNEGLIKEYDVVELEASGDLKGEDDEDMTPLINYYKMLNFRVKYEEDLQEQIESKSVMMYGVVSDLMDSCIQNEHKVSVELKKIIEQI
jgi:hypothetical protein